MPVSLVFPTATELSLIERSLLPVLTQDDEIFKMFPIVEKDSPLIEWEQKDSFRGLMSPRGINGSPESIKLLGSNRFQMKPGRYGNYIPINETDIELRRQVGTVNTPIPIDDLVIDAQEQLLNIRINRLRKILWDLVSTGTYSVPSGLAGAIMATDTFPLQTSTAATAWATVASATPLADLRALKLKLRGYSTEFGKGSKMYANSLYVNYLLNNANSNDLAGKRRDMGATFNVLEDVNRVMTASDLPEIVEYDKGYYDDSGTFQTFIPNNKVVVVGKRTNNATVGEFHMTRNANNPNAEPGPYTMVVDSLGDGNSQPVPRTIQVHDGFNGGPAIFYPQSIIILTV